MMHNPATRWCTFILLLGLAACGSGETSTPSGSAASAVPLPEGVQNFGEYEVHYRAMNTVDLRPEVALQYGLTRADNRAMLTVSVLRSQGAGLAGQPVSADVRVRVSNILAQTRDPQLREIRDGEAIYYVAEIPFTNEEILTFDLQVTPSGTNENLALRFRQQFYSSNVAQR